MTHSYLQAMSSVHLKYRANMAVRSSMSISINVFNEPMGLDFLPLVRPALDASILSESER